MDAMKKERLIELAESGLPPTAEEQRLLEADPAARTELDRLTVLFADVRRLPEPEIDEKELAGLLPAVRRGIESRRSRPPLAWLALRPAAARALAIAATLLLALNLLMPVAPEENPQGQVSQLDLVSSLPRRLHTKTSICSPTSRKWPTAAQKSFFSTIPPWR